MNQVLSKLNPYRIITNQIVKQIASNIEKEAKVLEIGGGQYTYKNYFDCEFVCTDYKEFKHIDKIADVTNLPFKNNSFDYILCLSVLEHLLETKKAISEMHRCLKNNGVLIISAPFIYPLHDEPKDYFRFTKHGLRKLLEKKFGTIEIVPFGLPFLFGHFVYAKHKTGENK